MYTCVHAEGYTAAATTERYDMYPPPPHMYMFSSDHVPLMFCCAQMFGHIILTNHGTALADYSSVSFMRHEGSSGMWVRE
jgi:hypothetical protein